MNLIAPTACQAEELCLDRIREILLQVDPADAPLRRLLEDVESRGQLQMEALRPLEGRAELDVETYFPSLGDSLGEGRLSRDSALYYVERLKEEAWRFFRDLARLATDAGAREAFTRAALDEIGQVARLREVIL
jgi:hypothetical protein